MNKEDVIRMARECGLTVRGELMLGVEAFASLVAAAEREAILQMSADNWYKTQADYDAAIRARGDNAADKWVLPTLHPVMEYRFSSFLRKLRHARRNP